MSILSGQCCCQSSAFSVPVNSVRFGFASCHCSICRLCHAAPFVLWSGLNADQSEHLSVQSSCGLNSFSSTSACTRYFCSKCGTHLYIKYADGPDRWAGEVWNILESSFFFLLIPFFPQDSFSHIYSDHAIAIFFRGSHGIDWETSISSCILLRQGKFSWGPPWVCKWPEVRWYDRSWAPSIAVLLQFEFFHIRINNKLRITTIVL